MTIKCRTERGSWFLHQEDCSDETERQFKCYHFSNEKNNAHQLQTVHQNKKGAGEGRGGGGRGVGGGGGGERGGGRKEEEEPGGKTGDGIFNPASLV